MHICFTFCLVVCRSIVSESAKREIVLLTLLAHSLGAQPDSAGETASCPVCMNLSHISARNKLETFFTVFLSNLIVLLMVMASQLRKVAFQTKHNFM